MIDEEQQYWTSDETKKFKNPKVKVIDNPDGRPRVEVTCSNCKDHSLVDLKDHTIKWFKCPKCNFPLAVTLDELYAVGYVDDVHHMGLLTSGPGGY